MLTHRNGFIYVGTEGSGNIISRIGDEKYYTVLHPICQIENYTDLTRLIWEDGQSPALLRPQQALISVIKENIVFVDGHVKAYQVNSPDLQGWTLWDLD